MSARLIATSLLAALLVTACDGVRVPGAPSTGETPSIPSSGRDAVAETGSEVAMDAEVETDPAAGTDAGPGTDASTPETDPTSGDPAPVDEGTLPATEPAADPAVANPNDGEAAPSDNPEDLPPPLASLTEINAVNCLVFSSDSVTVAELMDAGDPEPRVGLAAINGQAAMRASYPGIVKMQPAEDIGGGAVAHGHCGATRIANNWFVTASHCLDGGYDRIEFIVGAETLTSPLAMRIVAERAICHAAYGGAAERYSNDVALVEVSDEVAAGLTAIPIASLDAPTQTFTPRNYGEAWVAGWGLTNFEAGRLSNDLLSARVKVTNVGPALVLTQSIGGSGPCIGDSGGPLYIEESNGTRRLVGVLSAVEGNASNKFCEGTYTARFTNLRGFSGWIEDVITACETNSALCDIPG